MQPLRALMAEILVEGKDLLIDNEDVARIRSCLPANGPIPVEDLKILAEMRTEARAACSAFDELFFPALKSYLLADGQISQAEQFLLLRMLYGGGGIDDVERQFLIELRKELKKVTPEFEAIYQEALRE
jgi:hypothetical protein